MQSNADAKGCRTPVTEGAGRPGATSRQSQSCAVTRGPLHPEPLARLSSRQGRLPAKEAGQRHALSPQNSAVRSRSGTRDGRPAVGAQNGGPGPLTRGTENPVRGTSALWAGGRRKAASRVRARGSRSRNCPSQGEKDRNWRGGEEPGRLRAQGGGSQQWPGTVPRWIKAANAYLPCTGEHLSSSRPSKKGPESRTCGLVSGRKTLRSERCGQTLGGGRGGVRGPLGDQRRAGWWAA